MGRPKQTGWIYFVQAARGGFIKIGYTGDTRGVASRVTGIQGMCPNPIRCLGAYRGTLTEEDFIHFKFAATCVYGEWFTPTEELLVFIREVCTQPGFVARPPIPQIKLKAKTRKFLNLVARACHRGLTWKEAIAENLWLTAEVQGYTGLARQMLVQEMEHLEN